MKSVAFVLFFCFIGGAAFAQNTLKGIVVENRTDIMLSGIKVENLTQHKAVNTDPHGNFTIQAKKGDILCFSGLNYVPDTLFLINLKYLTVSLELRQNTLKEVNITTEEVNRSAFNYDAEKGPFGSHTVLYKPGGGLIVKIADSHKDAKKRAKLAQLELDGEKERQITAVFNKNNLKTYIPLAGQEMENFVIKYRPDISTYFSDSFNLSDYLNESYKDFLKIPEEKRKVVMYPKLNEVSN